jgi:hypothetical protein|tara:strand:+ start:468 stop:581 length:114 start_codon:yes stop_codon:yes gene_type:complete
MSKWSDKVEIIGGSKELRAALKKKLKAEVVKKTTKQK